MKRIFLIRRIISAVVVVCFLTTNAMAMPGQELGAALNAQRATLCVLIFCVPLSVDRCALRDVELLDQLIRSDMPLPDFRIFFFGKLQMHQLAEKAEIAVETDELFFFVRARKRIRKLRKKLFDLLK